MSKDISRANARPASFESGSRRTRDIFFMESQATIEVPVICTVCRCQYRLARIIPIVHAPATLAGVCPRCVRNQTTPRRGGRRAARGANVSGDN
jgi:hypothetical protein